jgi:hypothetical protein
MPENIVIIAKNISKTTEYIVTMAKNIARAKKNIVPIAKYIPTATEYMTIVTEVRRVEDWRCGLDSVSMNEMRYSHALIVNLLILVVSGFCVGVFYEEYNVRAAYYSRPYAGLLFTITPFWLVYLSLSINSRFRASSQLVRMLVVSIVGSLILAGYLFAHFALTYVQKPGGPSALSLLGPTVLLWVYTVLVFLIFSLKLSAAVGLFDRNFALFRK